MQGPVVFICVLRGEMQSSFFFLVADCESVASRYNQIFLYYHTLLLTETPSICYMHKLVEVLVAGKCDLLQEILLIQTCSIGKVPALLLQKVTVSHQ